MKNLKNISAEKWMGFFLFIFILGTACTRFIFGESEKVERVKPLFDSEVQKFGLALGESFKKTFREAKAKSIRDKDTVEVAPLFRKNSLKEFERAGLVSNEDVLDFERAAGASKAAIPKKKPLSKTQKKVMGQIQEAMQNSSSHLEFMDKIADINNKLFLNVPSEEILGLESVIASFYYTLDAVDVLAKEEGFFVNKKHTQKAGFGLGFITTITGGPNTFTGAFWNNLCNNLSLREFLGLTSAGAAGGAITGGTTFPVIGTVPGYAVGGLGGALSYGTYTIVTSFYDTVNQWNSNWGNNSNFSWPRYRW